MMKMTIDFSCKTTILLPFLEIETCYWFTVAMFAVFLIGVLFEYLISLREEISQGSWAYKNNENTATGALNRSTLDKIKITLYYFTVVCMSHLIMFILMTYNLGIILAVLLGNGLGFFLFGFSAKGAELSVPVLP